MSSQQPSIAIIGAGLSGLLLARYLQINSIACTIYEREASRSARAQGGSLDLHTHSGLLAMKEAGLLEKFKELARPEDDQTRILDKNGKLWFDDLGEDRSKLVQFLSVLPWGEERTEIDRTDLRNILLDSLQPDTIKWDHQFKFAEPLLSSSYELHFANAPIETADILIGADGTWSRVRPLLADIRPSYTGVSFIEVIITDIDNRHPSLAKLVGKGFACILGDGKGLIPQRNSRGTIRVYLSVGRTEEDWLEKNPLPDNPEEAREYLKSHFPTFDASVLELIDKCDDAPMRSWKIYAMPPGGIDWSSTRLKGITIIGDAAHVMSPFAGEGANLALLDAYELGKTLVATISRKGESLEKIDLGLRAFEKRMLKRSEESARESQDNMDLMYGPDAPKEFVDFFKFYTDPTNLVRAGLRYTRESLMGWYGY
ncbi:hypothetical protein FRB97_000731 [Tulasnella sp. 331]|nr:hypothetical protein FRB97_000731 [Tulasnella sp. 331]